MPTVYRLLFLIAAALLGSVASPVLAGTQEEDSFSFDDAPLENVITYPEWFKQSFLALDEDLQEAADNGKQGIIAYFGQQRCPYCKKLMDINFHQDDIVEYTQEHFDVIPIDIWSPEEVTLPDGRSMSERDYAVALNTNFTPSLVFYDPEGHIALRLRGYYPPYQHRAALEYVADKHYKKETFASYLARGDKTLHFEPGDLIEDPLFEPPPYQLDRTYGAADMPLLVIFEQGDCHACDVLHTGPLQRNVVREPLDKFEVVQLDMHADTPVVTPTGKSTTAREWARELGLFYAPTLIFYDEHGREIIRVDSVVQFVRLRNVLNYVLSKGYLEEPNFLRWGARTRKVLLEQQEQKQEQDQESQKLER